MRAILGFYGPQNASAIAGSLVLLLVAAGCYTYAPTAPTQPEPGSVVRAKLTEQGSAAVVEKLGPGVTDINGMFLETGADSISVLVESFLSTRQGLLAGDNEPIRLEVEQIAGMQQKRIARGRSLLLGVAFLGGAFLVTNIFGDDGRVVQSPDPDDPGPLEIVVPLLSRIPFGSP